MRYVGPGAIVGQQTPGVFPVAAVYTGAESSVPNVDQSSFTLSAYQIDISAADTLTASGTVKNVAGTALAGKTVTDTLVAAVVDAAKSRVTVNKTVMDPDGVDSVTVTVNVQDTLGGEDSVHPDYPIPDVQAANVVIAVSGSNNTITQPASPTDATGTTTGSFKTTQSGVTKTVTVTVDGTQLTDQPTVSTGDPPTPPDPGDPDYAMDSSGADTVRATQNGVTWSTGASNITVQTVPAGRSGYGLRFRYPGTGTDSSAEQGFNLGVSTITEFWADWSLYVPSNFTHKSPAPNNNKFFFIWANSYSTPGSLQVGVEYELPSGGDSRAKMLSMAQQYPASTIRSVQWNPYHNLTLLRESEAGTWVTIRVHARKSSSGSASDGCWEGWKDDVLMWRSTAWPFAYDGGNNYFQQGYFLGWANSGFDAQTDFYIHGVRFWWTNDPGWTDDS